VKVVFEIFLRQTGASFYTPDGKKLGFSDPSLLKDYWDLQLRLLNAGALIPADEAFVTVSIEEDAFSKGQSWVQYIWSNQLTATANGAKRPIGMLLFPTIDNAKRKGTYLKPSMFFSIAAKAENPDLAAKAFNFFLNDLGANDILLAERGVPVPENVRSYLFPKMDNNMKMSFDFVSLAAENSSDIDLPDPAANGEILALLRDIAQQVLSKSISSSEGASRFITRANQILSAR
jgi:multiple sugar transport system substrate-binding protein